MEDEIKYSYPKNMKIKTLTKDCFDGLTETEEYIKLKEKYCQRFYDLSHEFVEDCIQYQVESISQVGFFLGWMYPEFTEAQLDVFYEHLYEQDGDKSGRKTVYKFEKAE